MKTLKQHTKALLDLLPIGELMSNKYDDTTNMYKFWTGIALTYISIEDNLDTLKKELDIDTTDWLIERWEKEFGIPDEFFDVADTLEERIQNVLLKKAGLNLLNIADFRSIITRLGFDVELSTASEIRYPPYEVPFYPLSEPGAYKIVIVRGDTSVANIDYLTAFMQSLLPITAGLLIIDTGS